MVNPLTPGVHYKVILYLNVYVYTCMLWFSMYDFFANIRRQRIKNIKTSKYFKNFYTSILLRQHENNTNKGIIVNHQKSSKNNKILSPFFQV